MNALLQFRAHRRAGPIVAYSGHIVFTTVAGQGWLAGPKPSLDALLHLGSACPLIKVSAATRVKKW
jgi:hypothetical protein